MLIEALQPLKVRFPEGDLHMEPGKPVELSEDRAQRLLEKVPGKVRLVELPPLQVIETAQDSQESLLAVRIVGSVIGEYWFCLSEAAPFEPGDGLPIYRPSEIRALKTKGYGPDVLRALNQTKVELSGKVIR